MASLPRNPNQWWNFNSINELLVLRFCAIITLNLATTIYMNIHFMNTLWTMIWKMNDYEKLRDEWLEVEPLFLHIECSQLKWYLVRMSPVRLSWEVFWAWPRPRSCRRDYVKLVPTVSGLCHFVLFAGWNSHIVVCRSGLLDLALCLFF